MVQQLPAPVFIHPGYELQIPAFGDFSLGAIIGLPVETTIALERLICAGHFDHYPGLQVIGAHGGGFFPATSVGCARHPGPGGAIAWIAA